MIRPSAVSFLTILSFALTSSAISASAAPPKVAKEPEHIEVQHILIAFDGSLPGRPVGRTKDEAKKKAYDVLKQAKNKNSKFGELVQANTDDQYPGIYGMSNRGATPAPGEHPRDGMVPAFGDVGFKLKAGEVGIADFDPGKSPYGWHIIKRLK